MSKYQGDFIKEKPARGREMKTTAIPGEMFNTMKLVSAKKTLRNESLNPELETPKDDQVHLYHEGYVDGKLYLVPDENLDFMKDDVETKLKLKGMKGLLGDDQKDSYEVTRYDRFTSRIGNLLDQVDSLVSDSDDETTKNEHDDDSNSEEKEDKEEGDEKNGEEEGKDIKEESEKGGKRDVREEEEVKSKGEGDVVEEEEEESEGEEEKPQKEEAKSKGQVEKVEEEEEKSEGEGEKVEEENSYENTEQNGNDMDKTNEGVRALAQAPLDQARLRLLISGHFRKDQKPIYIIQEYKGNIDLFKGQKADFQSHRKLCEDGIDAYVSGRFYDETILEESGGKPVALNVKPQKIIIDENLTNVYDDYFEKVYNLESTDILLSGEFLKSGITKRITPFLSLGVKRGDNNTGNDVRKGETNKSADVFTCQLKPTVPFPNIGS